jgi:hypothetical protein
MNSDIYVKFLYAGSTVCKYKRVWEYSCLHQFNIEESSAAERMFTETEGIQVEWAEIIWKCITVVKSRR